MKKNTFRWQAIGWLLVLAAPATLQAQSWHWASAPGAIVDPAPVGAPGGSVIVAAAPDGAGNTVVAGNFSGSFTLGGTTLVSQGYSDVFVARLGPGGEWLQAVRAGGPSEDVVSGLKLDAAGNAIISGRFGNLVAGATAEFGSFALTSAGGTDAFVARLNPGGQWTQAVRAGGPGNDEANALALDAAGNAVVAGSFQGSPGFGPTTLAADGVTTAAFVARLNLAAGTWTQASQSTCAFSTVPFRNLVSAVALDAADNVVLAGQFDANTRFGALALSNALGGTSAYLARLSAGGQWTQAVQLTNNSRLAPPPTINALAVDGAGTATVAGVLLETVAFGPTTLVSAGSYDVFVARLDAAGQWTQAVRAGGPANDLARALAVDAAGNATVAGLFGVYGSPGQVATAAFGPLALSSSGGLYDVFVARLDAAGQWTQAVRAGGAGNDEANAVSIDAEGSITVAGSCGNAAGFGGFTLSGTTSFPMAFAARFAGTALATHAPAPAEVFALAPNPAAGLVRLSWPETSPAARPVQVLDALGREVRRQELPARTRAATLDLAGLAPGLYVVRCGAGASRLRVE
ncbi:T9SS type A sorting domain-containing protein [Hymenobacter sp. DH14]|uniref:T9SS type A sorting domain-containing protein n=1 Tax=Hymenobacter cyanobacteriorum TaxID=2926463 RepID=A0A9X1VG87_9BACT|nr:T9SS type A sorting domain-containing protein [Hymenobacter cyanobacteriorum]MCI1188187.1 T9SS type A sorting domain-containing protein [Hymenobacter cyanobacteriorum]